jgi:hypothetical protein
LIVPGSTDEEKKKQQPTTPQDKARLFAMGGFNENRLDFHSDGLLSDDGESYDLDELS